MATTKLTLAAALAKIEALEAQNADLALKLKGQIARGNRIASRASGAATQTCLGTIKREEDVFVLWRGNDRVGEFATYGDAKSALFPEPGTSG